MQDSIEINSGKNDSSFITQRAPRTAYLNIIITYILSLVLLFAGISKIIDATSLIENLSSIFPFLPETLLILISTLLPLVEITLAFLLVFSLYKGEMKRYRKIILLSTSVLFGIFFLYSIYGFVIGSRADCGCFGNVVKSSSGWGMIARNFVFLILSIVVLKRNRIH